MNKVFSFLILLMFFVACKEKTETRIVQVYSGGEKKTEADFLEDGKTRVAQRTYSENGTLLIEGPISGSSRDGEWKFYDFEGNLKSKRNYLNGKYHGLYQEFDKEGNVVLEGNYENGVRVGEWTNKNDQGDKEIIEEEELPVSIVNKNVVETYPNGQIKTEVIFNEDGTQKELQRSYHESGEIMLEGQFKDNMRSGKWTAFYKNGKRQSESHYLEDQLHGDYMLFMETGQVKIEGEYNFGNQTGNWMSYDEAGELISHIYYDSEGQVLEEIK